ncbi:ECF transporter S component [Candidatus Thorarchaeota archaeon]|nr:MAG: ECF transporter S component [Candidatus Thorarchaeota archaeon]
MKSDGNSFSASVFVALTAVMSGLVTIATAIIAIPFPTSTGYLNFGDTLVMISGMLLGPLGGFIAGGLGSALADVSLGYLAFAPLTFAVKGTEGFLVGLISKRSNEFGKLGARDLAGLVVGGVIMMLGYFVGEVFLIGYEAAIAELLFLNWIQATSGVVVAALVGPKVREYLAQSTGSKELWDAEEEL